MNTVLKKSKAYLLRLLSYHKGQIKIVQSKCIVIELIRIRKEADVNNRFFSEFGIFV